MSWLDIASKRYAKESRGSNLSATRGQRRHPFRSELPRKGMGAKLWFALTAIIARNSCLAVWQRSFGRIEGQTACHSDKWR